MKGIMKMDQRIKLAENLKSHMISRNLTITGVARQIGMNKSTLHNYCNGVVPRNLVKIKELADLFEISLSDLVFGSNGESLALDSNADIEGRFEVIIKRVSSSDFRK
jgi:transcriptional regulator with XRE-family HTH domain